MLSIKLLLFIFYFIFYLYSVNIITILISNYDIYQKFLLII